MNRLPLAQVTLCAVDCHTPALAAMALLQARRRIAFGRMLLLTQGWLPTVVLPGLEVVDIGPLREPAEHHDFIVRRLHAYIASSHVLLTRWDAGVMHPEAWTDEFLVHDFVAAPGGAAGLSLRSRRYLRAGADPRLDDAALDDERLCGHWRGFLEAVHGVSFAPEALARRFAAPETPRGDAAAAPRPFGFVGAGHLPALLGEAETLELVRRLPPAFWAGPGAAALEHALHAQSMPLALAALEQARLHAVAAAARIAGAA